MKKNDSYWMFRCFTLAEKGSGAVSPNPLVGAVIVKKNRVLGEGFHERFGGPHAEINALSDARRRGNDVTGATMYVNLEPCSHFGKTPPCADAIIRSGISRVVVPMLDPNPLISGKGIRRLQRQKIQCSIGVGKRPAKRLNERFIKYMSTGRPFIAVKAAQSADGFIAGGKETSRWITNSRSRKDVHRLRSCYDAILVGANTVSTDDPELTVRHIKGNNPVRILLDGNISVPVTSKIFNRAAPTIVYTSRSRSMFQVKKKQYLRAKGITVVELPSINGKISIANVISDIARRGLTSVLIEGGQSIYREFLQSREVDIIYLYTAAKILSKGLKTFDGISVSYRKILRRKQRFGSDCFFEYSVRYRSK